MQEEKSAMSSPLITKNKTMDSSMASADGVSFKRHHLRGTKRRLNYSNALSSPLDKILIVAQKKHRAMRLGLTPGKLTQLSFEGIQSAPNTAAKPVGKYNVDNLPLKSAFMAKDKFGKDDVLSSGGGHHASSNVAVYGSQSFGGPVHRSISTLFSDKTPDSSYSYISRSVSFSDNYSLYNYAPMAGTPSGGILLYNPNKAIMTINSRTNEIKTANDMACCLFGYGASELCSMKMTELIHSKKNQESLCETYLSKIGEPVLIAGKVVEAVTSDGELVAVSLWLKRIDSENKSIIPCENECCIAIVEPVERIVATVVFNSKGQIKNVDSNFAILNGLASQSEAEGQYITSFMPAFELPDNSGTLKKNIRKQHMVGYARNGVNFPLSIVIEPELDSNLGDTTLNKENISGSDLMKDIMIARPDREFDTDSLLMNATNCSLNASLLNKSNLSNLSTNSPVLGGKPQNERFYRGTIWVFTSVSGLVVMNSDGTVFSCNHHFAQIMFGYGQNDLINKHITSIIPTFYDDLNCGDSHPSFPVFGHDDSSYDFTNSYSVLTPSKKQLTKAAHDEVTSAMKECNLTNDSNGNHAADQWENRDLIMPRSDETMESTKTKRPTSLMLDLNPNNRSGYGLDGFKIIEGSYFGLGRHKDGSDLAIMYQVKRVELVDGFLYYLWISRDTEEFRVISSYNGPGIRMYNTNLGSVSETSFMNDSSISDCSEITPGSGFSPSICESKSNLNLGVNASSFQINETYDPLDSELTSGDYGSNYTNLDEIGKGAYGYVRMAYHNETKLMVVTKFIKKAKVYADSWVTKADGKTRVPMEVSLLLSLEHPNIVRVLNVYENELFYHVVMEKHGSGMDLFEFIDRVPDLDEQVASYLFRQVVSAVSHLHSLNILHRDIKDENVILNERFHARLIDFGSATFMEPGKTFSTFCGTVEYCSPEVLLGNRYKGPELEVWSLGVTLYTLVFGENPFFDVDETIKCDLHPPFEVSDELMKVICSLLEPDPNTRYTIKQIENDPWVNQLVDIGSYRFQDVVSCTEREANPPKFYSAERMHSPIPRGPVSNFSTSTPLVSKTGSAKSNNPLCEPVRKLHL